MHEVELFGLDKTDHSFAYNIGQGKDILVNNTFFECLHFHDYVLSHILLTVLREAPENQRATYMWMTRKPTEHGIQSHVTLSNCPIHTLREHQPELLHI